MSGWATWMVGLGVIATESAFIDAVGVPWAGTQLALALVVWVAHRRSFVAGAVLVAAWVPAVVWTSGAPHGSFALASAGVYVLLAALVEGGGQGWGIREMLAGAAGCLLHAVLLLGVLAAIGADSHLLASVARSSPFAVAQTFVALGPLGWLLDRADAAAGARR